jgi:hypothetical protein
LDVISECESSSCYVKYLSIRALSGESHVTLLSVQEKYS